MRWKFAVHSGSNGSSHPKVLHLYWLKRPARMFRHRRALFRKGHGGWWWRTASDQSGRSWPRSFDIPRSRTFSTSTPACHRSAPCCGRSRPASGSVTSARWRRGSCCSCERMILHRRSLYRFSGAAARAVGLTAGCGETCALASCSGGMCTACFATGSPLLKAFFGTAVVAMVLYA